MSDYRDRYVVQHYGHLSMQTAMDAKTPTVWRWAKGYGEEKIIQGVAKLFIGASLYFDNPISQDAAESVVVKILADYEMSNLKLEDLVVCCKEITESNQFGKLNPAKILNHVKGYKERRTKAAIAQSLDSVQQSKMYDGNMTDRIHATIKNSTKDKSKDVDRTRAQARKYYK